MHVVGRVVMQQVVMRGVAAGDHGTIDQHHVANFQGADFFLAERRLQAHLAARQVESCTRRNQALDGAAGIAIEPLGNGAAFRVEQILPAGGTPSNRKPRLRRSWREAGSPP